MITELKEEVSLFYKQIKEDQQWSYDKLSLESGLCKTQLTNILKHKGQDITLDRMFEGLWSMDYFINLSVEVKDES